MQDLRRQQDEQDERIEEKREPECQQERECLRVESSPPTGMFSEDENESDEN